MNDLPIPQMLREFGIADGASQQLARQSLADWGVITRPDRQKIAAYKRDDALTALTVSFRWHCSNGDCSTAARDAPPETPPLLVDQLHCEICGGSKDVSALGRMAAALAAAGLSRVLVVGGTENKCREIREKSPGGIEWKFVDGKAARPDRLLSPYREWAEVIVLWASTVLDHRVSAHFPARGDDRVITVPRRGIAALADAVAQHVQGPGAGEFG